MRPTKMSRREVLAGSAAALALLHPALAAAAGESAAGPAFGTDADSLRRLVGESFELRRAGGEVVAMRLDEVTDHHFGGARPESLARKSAFSATFRAAAAPLGGDELCVLCHARFGEMPLLMSSFRDGRGGAFLAIFN